ncbi:hypothetical protein LXL04_015556 [Taraxacum kok-saghyz]
MNDGIQSAKSVIPLPGPFGAFYRGLAMGRGGGLAMAFWKLYLTEEKAQSTAISMVGYTYTDLVGSVFTGGQPHIPVAHQASANKQPDNNETQELWIKHVNGWSKNVATLNKSLLVTNQINDTYGVKDDMRQRYVNAVKKLTKAFYRFTVKQVIISYNKKEETRNNLDSATFDHLPKNVVVEVIPNCSINNQDILGMGVYWSNTYKDAVGLTLKCVGC